MDDEIEDRLESLADDVRDHFDSIEQDVPTQSYLVGGACRDVVIGLEPNDYDFVAVGESPETMEARGFEDLESSSFPVYMDSEGEEWALARTEQKDGEGYTGFSVETENVTLEEDLERRDIRCNAIAMDPDPDDTSYAESDYGVVQDEYNFVIRDPHGGVRDIQDGVLRHTSDAFSEDPLRILRVSRYAGRFAVPFGEDPYEDVRSNELHQFATRHGNVVENGFVVAHETVEMMRRVAPELNRMSRDRIGMEIRKAMEQARRPSRVFDVLEECGALAVLIPELDRGTIVPAGPEEYHAEGSLYDHTAMVIDRMAGLCDDRGIDGFDRVTRLLMALSHDLGKSIMADDVGGLHSDDPPVHFGGHDEIGAENMETIVRQLGLGKELTEKMADASRYHMDVHDFVTMDAEETLSFVQEVRRGRGATIEELIDLAKSDHEGRLQVVSTDPIEGTDEERTTVERPTFDRVPFDNRRRLVESVLNATDGFTVMLEGLCDEHSEEKLSCPGGTSEIFVGDDEKLLTDVLEDCEDCRTPGSWIGERIDEKRVEKIREALIESEKRNS